MAWGVRQGDLDEARAEALEGRPVTDRPSGTRGLTVEELNDPAAFDQRWETHFKDYLVECVKESFEGSKLRREFDEECWRAHENDMREFADKEAWQSKIVINKPWTTTLQATSIIRRGMIERPDYFEIDPQDGDDPMQRLLADYWTQALRYWTTLDEAKLQYEFADASHFGFAVGLSQSIKFLWKPDRTGRYGLRLRRFEPWKAYDDPERQPRRPWSGLYNIHEEWVDLHVLQQGQADGFYRHVDDLAVAAQPSDSAALWRHSVEEQREEERRKSGLASMRNKYRKQVLVREFWGSVLDEHGKMLAPDVSFSVAGNRVIRGPIVTPFPLDSDLRWPWMDYAPLPHPVRYHGYALYEGVLAIWKFMNQLLNLYLDNENFRINNMYEISPEKLRNPADDDVFPGKKFIRKSNAPEGPAVQPVLKAGSNLADVQFMWGLATNLWENGSFVTEFVKGEQGIRREITATEVAQKTQQALGVFDSIGRDCEDGAVMTLRGIYEFLRTFWFDLGAAPFKKLTETNRLAQAVQQGMFPEERMRALALHGAQFRIRGVSKAFEKATIVQKLQAIAGMASSPVFGMYFKPYLIARRTAEELDQPELVLSPEELQQQQQQQQQQALAQAIETAKGAALHVAGGGAPGAPASASPGSRTPPAPRGPQGRPAPEPSGPSPALGPQGGGP